MKTSFFIGSICLMMASLIPVTEVLSQRDNNVDYSEEIDSVIWVNFKNAYENRDAEAFIFLHAPDVMRVTKYSGIRIGQDFRDHIRASYGRPNQSRRTIDFRFEHRIHSSNAAYEVGYYRVRTHSESGDSKDYFGRFNVVLKRVDGEWKIAQDWDTDVINGHKIGASDFERLIEKD